MRKQFYAVLALLAFAGNSVSTVTVSAETTKQVQNRLDGLTAWQLLLEFDLNDLFRRRIAMTVCEAPLKAIKLVDKRIVSTLAETLVIEERIRKVRKTLLEIQLKAQPKTPSPKPTESISDQNSSIPAPPPIRPTSPRLTSLMSSTKVAPRKVAQTSNVSPAPQKATGARADLFQQIRDFKFNPRKTSDPVPPIKRAATNPVTQKEHTAASSDTNSFFLDTLKAKFTNAHPAETPDPQDDDNWEE